MDASTPAPAARRFLSLRKTAELYPAIPLTTLRWFRARNAPGFNECLLRIAGKKLLVDVDAYENWLLSQRLTGGAT